MEMFSHDTSRLRFAPISRSGEVSVRLPRTHSLVSQTLSRSGNDGVSATHLISSPVMGCMRSIISHDRSDRQDIQGWAKDDEALACQLYSHVAHQYTAIVIAYIKPGMPSQNELV